MCFDDGDNNQFSIIIIISEHPEEEEESIMSSSTTSSSTEYHHSTTTTNNNDDNSNNPSNTPKCPCCNNPWSAATSEIFSKLCAECSTTTTTTTTTNTADNDNDNNNDKKMNLKKYLDESISPTLDFYHYANGSWLQENPIPAGYPSWNTFLQLHTLSQERLKDLLLDNNENDDDDDDDNEIEMKVKTFYNAAMDEESIESEGIGPLKDVLTLCDDIANVVGKNNNEEVASCLGKLLSNYGISSFFSIGKI